MHALRACRFALTLFLGAKIWLAAIQVLAITSDLFQVLTLPIYLSCWVLLLLFACPLGLPLENKGILDKHFLIRSVGTQI